MAKAVDIVEIGAVLHDETIDVDGSVPDVPDVLNVELLAELKAECVTVKTVDVVGLDTVMHGDTVDALDMMHAMC